MTNQMKNENTIYDNANIITDTLEIIARAKQDPDLEDFEIINYSNEEKQEDRKVLREFAVGEQLAHNIAYQELKDGQTISLVEADLVTRSYQVMNVITGHGGVAAKILLPLHSDNSQVHVIFTGTRDFATLHADLERNAGEEAIHKNGNMDRILVQINDAISYVNYRTNKPVELSFSGHSLGGALAGQCMAAAMGRKMTNQLDDPHTSDTTKNKIVAENNKLAKYFEETYQISQKEVAAQDRMSFSKVAKFKIHSWNKTGESKAVENYSNEIANMIVEKEGREAITARFGMVGGDSVQQTGEGNILSACQADVAVLKADIGVEGFAQRNAAQGMFGAGAMALLGGLTLGPVGAMVAGGTIGMFYAGKTAKTALEAHTAYHFNNEIENVPAKINYELHRNNDSHGQAKITARLQKKSKALQTSVLQGAKACLHKCGQGISSLFGRRKKPEAAVQKEVPSVEKEEVPGKKRRFFTW